MEPPNFRGLLFFIFVGLSVNIWNNVGMLNFFIHTVLVSLLSQSQFVQEGITIKEVDAFNGTTLQFSNDFLNVRSDEQISIIDFPLSKN